MKIVVDANRVVSAILRDGSTRRALIETSSVLFAPDWLREELGRYRAQLMLRTGLEADAYDALVAHLIASIEFVRVEERLEASRRADRALRGRDLDDAPCLAVALAVGADAIWSEDTDFDAQDLVPRTRHPDRIVR